MRLNTLAHWILPAAIALPLVNASADTLASSGGSSASELELLRQQVQKQQSLIEQQQQRLGTLESKDEKGWMTQRRAEEIKSLVREVLSDADTRASLLDSAVTAGHNGKNFFLASEDGNFLLTVAAEAQIRYIYNHLQDDTPATDDDTNGFQIRRARLDFRGHAYDPKLTYRLRINADRSTGNVGLEYAYLGYDLAEDWNVKIGQFKPLFLREENVSSVRQLAVERTYASDYFTIDYAQGAELTYDGQWFHPSLTFYDGSYTQNSEFTADRSDFALAGRAEFLLAGDWKQFSDFSSWSKDKPGVLLGVAGGYERGNGGGGTNTPDIFKYTADISAEYAGFNLFAAFYGQHFDVNDSSAGLPSNLDQADQYSFVVQGGTFVIPDKLELFARYEYLDFDGVYYRNNGASTQGGSGNLTGSDSLSIVTLGGNWYIHKHNTKFSVDVQWALDPVPVANTGGGLLASTEKDQIAVRAQLQWSF
ncbi:MAG: porin [Phycisphaeraceae bacterium]